jgi:transposase-like protein
MPKKNHPISADLKKQIIDRVKTGEAPVTQIAQDHGVHPKTIYGWLAKGAQAPPTWRDLGRLRKENKMLHELVGRLTVKLAQTEKKELGL